MISSKKQDNYCYLPVAIQIAVLLHFRIMNPSLYNSESTRYILELRIAGKPVETHEYTSEGLRYLAFVDLLQKTTQTPDGLVRSYLFTSTNPLGQIVESPRYVGYWTGHAHEGSSLSAPEVYQH